ILSSRPPWARPSTASGTNTVNKLTEAQRARLRALRKSYQAELPEKLALIASAVAALEGREWDRARLQHLYQHIHKLAGSAAIYGFDEISRAAGSLEAWASSALTADPAPEARLEQAPMVDALHQAFSTSRTSRPRGG